MSDADVYIGGVACNFPFHPPVTLGVKPSPASVSRPCDGSLPCHLSIALYWSAVNRGGLHYAFDVGGSGVVGMVEAGELEDFFYVGLDDLDFGCLFFFHVLHFWGK